MVQASGMRAPDGVSHGRFHDRLAHVRAGRQQRSVSVSTPRRQANRPVGLPIDPCVVRPEHGLEDYTSRVKDMTKHVREALAHPLTEAALDSALLDGDGEVDALRDALHTATFTADEVRAPIDRSSAWQAGQRDVK